MTSYIENRAGMLRLGNLKVVRAGFLTYRHNGGPAGFVFTKNALHHLPDFWKVHALTRIARLLRPGGVLRLRDIVFSFAPERADERIGSWIESMTKEPGGWSREELEAHVREEYSTYTWLFEPMLERAGFSIDDSWYSDSGVYARYTCRRARRA